MVNTGSQLGQSFLTAMPALTDNADIQQAMRMLWFGSPNATEPTDQGIEHFLSELSANVNTLAARMSTDLIYSSTAPVRDTVNYSDWIWIDTSSTNADGASRPMYLWTGAAWSPIAGVANPAAAYTWTNSQTFNESLKIVKAINSYADAAARTAGLSNATNGTLSYLTNAGRYEYYKDGAWIPIGSIEKVVETRSAVETTMAESDADKILQFTNAGASKYIIGINQIKIGTSIYPTRQANGTLTIEAGSGVILNSGNNVLGQHASAILTKIAANTWVLWGVGTSLPPGGTFNQAPLKKDGTDYNIGWVSVVPADGGTFTGTITIPTANITTLNVSGSLNAPNNVLKINGHSLYAQSTQPIGLAAGDIWIQT